MIDPKHPRAVSLQTRDELVKGVTMGITSLNGLIAQGRGEALDYLLSEKTHNFALEAITASAALLVLAQNPVLSTNGNSVMLAGKEYVELSKILNCPIEINLFHRIPAREIAIKKYLENLGAKKITGVGSDASVEIKGIASLRKQVSPNGIGKADVVFIPIEDGDRTEAIVALGKKVITVDLNPLSRTAKMATITIVDNIIRCMPLLSAKVKEFQSKDKTELETIIAAFDNKKNLLEAEKVIRTTV